MSSSRAPRANALGSRAGGGRVVSSSVKSSNAAGAGGGGGVRRNVGTGPDAYTGNGGGSAPKAASLKLINGDQEIALIDNLVTIGRRKECDICLNDPLVSGNHAQIANGFVVDSGSTNGTLLNGQLLKAGQKKMLQRGDKLQIGDRILRIEEGAPKQQDDVQELSRSKKFLGGFKKEEDEKEEEESKKEEDPEEAKMTVDELMDKEFKKIIGHDKIKKQLKQFHKKVQLDQIRASNGKESDQKRLYHMIFSGPPGTGKTTMANLVAKIMLKMKLVSSDKVVFVNNSLELIGSFVGQTPAKVDAKVNEAKGGVLFIDEAYSIVKGGGERDSNGGQFGREAIDTIMKHMDPPSCVFIFAGYEKPMEDFLRMNEGLARRIPYRYQFEAYAVDQLLQIFQVMCESKGEALEPGVIEAIPALLSEIPSEMLSTQNAGLISNWVSFAQIERDDRVDIDEALKNPDLASTLLLEDLKMALPKVKEMKGAGEKKPAVLSNEPELRYAEQ